MKLLTLFSVALFISSAAAQTPPPAPQVPPATDSGKTIIELWNKAAAPQVPELKQVKVKPAETALLILDIEQRTTNPQQRPRAVYSVTPIKKLLDYARAHKILVVYSTTSGGTPETILKEVAPAAGEVVVKAGVDKFYGTELENVLKKAGIKSVIITGTAAEGAVLGTAIGAAMRNLSIIVPVDGMSSSNLFAEQYVAWHLLNAPGTRQLSTLTKSDMITAE